ncbi:hypothetical protein C8Q80DRAFT_1205911 [Daedaleopsis nitida]|nr:hypothetical protein C8Q80DRAFT_1205911 [Daedaleopsis nitida]
MHAALLIDEVLQLVFDFCEHSETEPQWMFTQLARCCRAWKDPALDRLWARLNGVEPLLALLPKSYEKTFCRVPSERFLANAARVRQITHSKDNLSAAIFRDLSPVLPRLETVALSFHGCMVPWKWTTSTRLKTVSIKVGFSLSSNAVVERSNAAASFLREAGRSAPDLHTLQIRGRMSAALNESVAALANLQSLTVQASCYLAPSTLAMIATFPRLRELEVHASHIDADEFEDSLPPAAHFFPALEELTIRTCGPLLTSILERLPVSTLSKLHVEMAKSIGGPSYMKPIFELLAEKASASLRELTIEDGTETDDLERYPPPPGTPRWYSLDLLSPLARMKQLRRVVMRDPDLRDGDLEVLAKWWPALEHLDLGMFDPEHFVPKWKAQMTPAAFGVAAKAFAKLERLGLPAKPPVEVDPKQAQQTTLRALMVGDVTSPAQDGRPTEVAVDSPAETIDVVAVVDALLHMFPSLRTLDSPSTVLTERFVAVVNTQ